jgi:hypothetical protein
MVNTRLLREDRLRLQLRQAPRTTWHAIAKIMRGAVNDGWTAEEVRQLAREETHLSWGVLTRYLNVLRRVEIAAVVARLPLEELLSDGFVGVELACRLYDRSLEDGIRALLGLRAGEFAPTDLRTWLDDAPAGDADSDVLARGRLLRRNASEIRAVEDAAEEARGNLFPNDSIIRRRRGLQYFRRVGLEILSKDGAPLVGLDVVTDSSLRRESLDAGLAQSVLLSTFFPRFYLAFSPGTEIAAIEDARAALEMIGVPWVGLVRVSGEGRLERPLREPDGPPVPDRSSRYADLVSAFAVGRTSS